MEKGKKLLLVLLGTAHSLNHSLFLILPPLLETVVEELDASLGMIGLIIMLSGLIYGAGSLVGGPWSDKIGEVKVLRISLALSGISTFLFLVVRDTVSFGFSLLMMAACASLYHPTANNLISKVFERGMAEAMGLHGVGGNIGYMFTPSIAVILGILFGWRVPFAFFGFLSILVSFLLSRTSPQKRKRTQVKVRIWDVFKIPGLWILFIYNIAVGLYFRGIDYFFPIFLSSDPARGGKGFSRELAAHAATSVLVLGVLGQWLGGKASDRFGSRKTLVVTSTGVLLGLLLLLMIRHPLLGVPLFVLLYGLFFFGHQPALNSLVGQLTPDDKKGAAFGIYFFFSFGLGSVSTAIAGHCAERYGLDSAFYVMTLFSFVALLLSLMILARAKRSLGVG